MNDPVYIQHVNPNNKLSFEKDKVGTKYDISRRKIEHTPKQREIKELNPEYMEIDLPVLPTLPDETTGISFDPENITVDI